MTRQRDPNDQKNFMIAIVLSLVVLLGWQYFFARPQIIKERERIEFEQRNADKAKNERGALTGANKSDGTSDSTVSPTPKAAPLEILPRDAALKVSPRVPIKTPSLEGSIALKSGRIDDLTLVKYHQTVDPKSPKVTLLSPSQSDEAYFAEFGWTPQAGANIKVPTRDTVWKLEEGSTLTSETPVTLRWDNGEGIVFRRTVAVDENYMFKITDEIENKTDSNVALLPYGRVHRYGKPDTAPFYILHEGLIGVAGEDGLQEITYSEAVDEGRAFKFDNAVGGWLGITDKYWATTLIPDQNAPFRVNFTAWAANSPGEKESFQADFLRPAVVVPPNTRKGVEGHLFAGAKQATLVERYEDKLSVKQFDLMIDWGWFYFITKPLFWLLEGINSFVGNFGVSILILTVLVKLLFYPLANKQYESMARMKKLQPEMARIKETFKEDPQRQQKEMFELYRKEKINPLAGCWPILLQIPVFFALYKVLFVTIDMRHAPFFGWIQDLSAPDPTSLFNLFGLLPYQVPEFLHIGVWPILMGLTMWVQMQLNPPQPDPIQQQIFNWMPLIFTFLLATFPAGLVIYWTWSNLLSVLQQWRINTKNGAEIHLVQNMKRNFAPLLRLLGLADKSEANNADKS